MQRARPANGRFSPAAIRLGQPEALFVAGAAGDQLAVFVIEFGGDDAGRDADAVTAGLQAAGLTVHDVLARNDAYHALETVDGLIRTGPTGTNVNDVAVVLLRR